MHSLAQRANSWASTLTSALFAVFILVSVLTLAFPPIFGNDHKGVRFNASKPIVSLKNTRNYGATRGTPKENAKFKFDMVVDFTNIVDWNTKQVFAYVYVELDDDSTGIESEESNKIVIWDKIFTDKNNMYFNMKNVKSKYSLWDYAPNLHGREGHFKLGYNIQPHIGPLTFGSIDLNEAFTFPDVKE